MNELAEVDFLELSEFDLDIQLHPGELEFRQTIHASGTCGGCPAWTDEGSTCKFSCQDTCGGTCGFDCPTSPAECVQPGNITQSATCICGNHY